MKIILLMMIMSFISCSTKKKVDNKEESKKKTAHKKNKNKENKKKKSKKKKDNAEVLGAVNKDDRIPPSEYRGIVLHLLGGFSLGDTGQAYTSDSSSGVTGGTNIEFVGNLQTVFMTKGFFLGGDLRYGAGAHEEKNYNSVVVSISDSSSTVTTTEDESQDAISIALGGVVGYEFDFGMKLYAGYAPYSVLTLVDENNSEDKYSGNSVKIGIDFLTKRGMGFGVQRVITKYNEQNGSSFPRQFTSDGSTIDVGQVEVSEYIFYYHIPFQFKDL